MLAPTAILETFVSAIPEESAMEIEKLIETYLTRCGKVFISGQYDVPWKEQELEGGACPDIIALDFSRYPREVVVVEITTSVRLQGLIKRVRERHTRWYAPLQRMLREDGVIDEDWSIRFLGFVRGDNGIIDKARRTFANDLDVTFYPIERAILLHDYWDERIAKGLPRRP